jgi:hypothetical protein
LVVVILENLSRKIGLLLASLLLTCLSRRYSVLPLLAHDLLLRHTLLPYLLWQLPLLLAFLPTHLSGILPNDLLALLLRLRSKDLLRHLLTLNALLLTSHLSRRLTENLLLPHLRHLPRLLLPHLRHLSGLRLRPLLTLLPHLWLAAPTIATAATSLLSRRRAAAAIAATMAFTLAKNVLIQTADKQKAKCDRGNKLL